MKQDTRMKSKLTLSLPAKTITEAKMIAKQRHISVSGLFSESLTYWKSDMPSQLGDNSLEQGSTGSMEDLLGAFSAQKPFDERSARIRRKHE